MATPRGFRAMSEEHLRQLQKLAQSRSDIRRLKKLYDRAQYELEQKLSVLSGGRRMRTITYSVQQHRSFLAQIKQAQMEMAKILGSSLSQSTLSTQELALRQLIRKVKRMEKKFADAAITLPIEEASRFHGVIDKNRTSLLKMHQTSMARYGSRLVKSMERELAQSLVQGESIYEAIDRVAEKADLEWWQAERIVRTEQAWAYNATNEAGIRESAKDFPDMMLRWTEHVTDSGQAMDDRVGDDSIVMHGQLARPGGKFTMPADPRVHRSLWGKSWNHPPNRPNDRSTLQPWRPRWGIPGWIYKSGKRVPYRGSRK